MVMQLLSHSKKNAKGKTYTYYSIAEPYWEDNKNKKRDLFYLGSLMPLQAQQIRNILKVTQSEDTFTATFEDLLFFHRLKKPAIPDKKKYQRQTSQNSLLSIDS